MRLILALVLTVGPAAQAYGFMIRHDYTTCAQCHVDPSGGSVLTPYGRAQGELLLRTRYSGTRDDEPGKVAGFLWGLFEPPEELLLGGDVRLALVTASAFSKVRVFPMQADLAGAVKSGKLTASVSLGLGSSATEAAKIVGDAVQLISRHHWVGYAPDEEQAFLIRAGRIPLPFGLRIPEHTSWVRALTRTDANISQQHGLSLAYSGDRLRAEVMAIAGNLQLSPAAFRERGYSGFIEWSPSEGSSLGLSSLITHAERDVFDPQRSVFRHAHGLFARVRPWRPLLLSVEADLTHLSRSSIGGATGAVALMQADLEPVQGLHLVALGEATIADFLKVGEDDNRVGVGGWAGVWWFFAPHSDLRVDFVARRQVDGALNLSLLAQLHFFL